MAKTARTYDRRDNAGEWFHEDGTPCPTYWSDRSVALDGTLYWCTEHQQHVYVAPEMNPVTMTFTVPRKWWQRLLRRPKQYRVIVIPKAKLYHG